jgi:hypothetical protein
VSWAKLHEVRVKVSWACASNKVVHVYVLDLYDAWTDNLQSFLVLDDVQLGDFSVPTRVRNK